MNGQKVYLVLVSSAAATAAELEIKTEFTHSRVASLEAERANLKKVIAGSENAASSQGDLIQVNNSCSASF